MSKGPPAFNDSDDDDRPLLLACGVNERARAVHHPRVSAAVRILIVVLFRETVGRNSYSH